jgi:hypothetical protein
MGDALKRFPRRPQNDVRTPNQAVLYTGTLPNGVTYVVRAFSLAEARKKIRELAPEPLRKQITVARAQIR